MPAPPTQVGLLGLGHRLPAPTGAGEHGAAASDAERAMFSASAGRRVLAPGESLEALMAGAAEDALAQAGIKPEQVDRLYGYALLSKHVSPNGLFEVHQRLGLPASTWVVPIATDFTNFLSSIALAREAVASGGARYVLVVCGGSLSRHMEPGTGYAVSIGDAAAAAVVGPSETRVIVDALFDTDASLLEAGLITTAGATATTVLGGPEVPRFQLTPALLPRLHDHGIERPIHLVRALLAKNGVGEDQYTLIAHQATRVLMGHWQEGLRPRAFLDTFDEVGNATITSIPVTLSLRGFLVETPFMVLMSPGPGMHVMAVLMRR